MIPQADIIRTLINKNCTDESVMSMALSLDCTLPKLLEKLTEVERFDLALDVSMKLGLDVMPLWKTWAMRCLKKRNFKGAREKFRHCFLRLRQPGNRASPVQSRLLADIVCELTKMDEHQLALAEEIELIKNGKIELDATGDESRPEGVQRRSPITSKPILYSECDYYLKEYGGVEDRIKFYTRHSLWIEAVKLLLEKREQISLDKFFLNEVFLFATSTGSLSDLVMAFLRFDSNIIQSARYFKSIYDFCLRYRRYNLLYYVQSFIEDYVAAAQTQITFFYLRRPVQGYRELNHRLSSLTNARKNYQDYLDKQKCDPRSEDNSVSTLLSRMQPEQTERLIRMIDTQLEITPNFALNEVTGCIKDIDLSFINDSDKEGDDGDDLPVTIFDDCEKRKTLLAALLLIYYDLSYSSYLSRNGLEMANKLCRDYELDKIKVFKTAMRIIIEDESCDLLESTSLLLDRLKEDYYSNKSDYESAITAIVRSRKSVLSASATHKQIPGKTQAQDPITKRSQSGQGATLVGQKTSMPMFGGGGDGDDAQSGADRVAPIIARQRLTGSGIVSPSNARVSVTETPSVATPATAEPAAAGATAAAAAAAAAASGKLIGKAPATTGGGGASRLQLSELEAARAICDEVIRDSIGSCREPDYKMELAKLLSGEAKIELYIEHGKLSNAQTLACNMNRPDYVSSIIEEAAKLNQNHVKTVCQLWLAKH